LKLKKERPEYQKNATATVEIELKTDKLLGKILSKTTVPKTLVFQKAMKTNRQSLFQFLYHPQVPPDNKGSEKGVRNFKAKQKVSGQFKTGQVAYSILRSVIDSGLKRNIPEMQSMMSIAQMPVLVIE